MHKKYFPVLKTLVPLVHVKWISVHFVDVRYV